MRTVLPDQLERGRIRNGEYASTQLDGPFGAFVVRGSSNVDLRIISSGAWRQYQWEHVSVSLKNRCPNWDEMCFVKDLFWNEDEVVMQLHPAKKDYVNYHPFCLHMWKPIAAEIPLPPRFMVGP